MDNTKVKRIIILLIGICLWTFYILQNELANYGIYSVVSYQIHEIASVIPILCICASIIWFIKLLYTSIKKKSKDVLFAIVLLCILLLQGSYLHSMSKECSTTSVVKIVSIDEAQNSLVVEQVESGKVLELESLMLVNNMVEPEGQTYLVTYSWNEKNPNKGKLRMIQTVSSSDIKTTDSVVVGSAELGEYILVLRICDGYYEYEHSVGPNQGNNWVGDYELAILEMASGEEISKYPLQEWGEAMRFGEPFPLNLTDYNNDDTYELLIGQRISDNQNSCYMYYITKELQIGCYDNIGEIIMSESKSSPVLSLSEGSLQYAAYNNSIGEWVQHTIDLALLTQENTQTTLLDVMNIALPEGFSTGEFDLYLEQGGGVSILNSDGDEVGIIGIHRITEGIFEQGNLVAAETSPMVYYEDIYFGTLVEDEAMLQRAKSHIVESNKIYTELLVSYPIDQNQSIVIGNMP